MIQYGTIKEVDVSTGSVLVEFEQFETEANCQVLVPTTGSNNVFYLPSVGTQVVCWIEKNKKLVLGAVFSESEQVPEGVDENTELRQFGKTVITSKNDLFKVKQDKISLEFSNNKFILKNDLMALKTVLNDILTAIKNLTVSTSMGPSGTPLPPTLQEVTLLEQNIDKLLND